MRLGGNSGMEMAAGGPPVWPPALKPDSTFVTLLASGYVTYVSTIPAKAASREDDVDVTFIVCELSDAQYGQTRPMDTK
ncbi:hypothetical protein VTN77DRAFT_1556 [Rasamsonia byssochlamydoides]|uniref:uncharacterized protein n=1 Tax=Rasamsonia byssochlamydoides TaxID=89139 RepID=UPI0037444BC4